MSTGTTNHDTSNDRVGAAFVLVDDDEFIRRTLTSMLRQSFPDRRVEVFAEGRPAMEFCRRAPVEILVTDLGLPDIHGLDIIRGLRVDRRIDHVIVMTGSPTDDLPRELWDLGVAGFIDKTSLHDHAQAAIERVLAGGMYFSAQVTPARLREPSGEPASTVAAAVLSGRELEVSRLVATGLLSKEIADRLQLSPRTVEKYRARAMHKVGVRSVPQLVYWCLRQGVL